MKKMICMHTLGLGVDDGHIVLKTWKNLKQQTVKPILKKDKYGKHLVWEANSDNHLIV